MSHFVEKIKDFLKDADFNRKKIIATIENQTISTTGKDNDGEIIPLIGLTQIKNSMDKKNIFGSSYHYFSGSPKMILKNLKIVQIEELHHLKGDVDILDKDVIEDFKSGKLKGFSISFSSK